MVFSVVVNWSKQWLRSAMDNALPSHFEGPGFDFFRVRLFFFVVFLFCFLSPLKKHIGSVLQHHFIRK